MSHLVSDKKNLLIILIVVFAFFIRFTQLDKIPASLYYDEVDYGYQARSIIKTFKDYRGNFSPFYVHSFNDIRAPIPAYFTVLTTFLFSVPELQVRMPVVLLGTAVVFLAYYLAVELTKNYWAGFLTALTFAANPYQIQFSRFNHEGMSMLFFYMLGAIFFISGLRDKKYWKLVFSVIFFSLTVYCYRTMSFYVPMTFVILYAVFYKQLIIFGLKKIFFLGLIALFIIVPFLYFTTFGAPDLPRINQISIFSDPQVSVWVQRNREVDSADFVNSEIGKSASWFSFIFHSKLISWLDLLFNNYYKSFSTEFLFISGEHNPRHSVGQMGQLFFIDILPLGSGIFFLFKKIKNKNNLWLLIWFFTAPIPAALTFDGAFHSGRLLIWSVPLLLIIGIGWQEFFNWVYKNKKIWIGFSAGMIWAVLFIFYLHRYFVHYPIESARNFGYGFEEMMLKIDSIKNNYKKIKMVWTNDPPMIYYLFWAQTDPKLLHEHGSDFSVGRKIKNELSKFEVIDWKDVQMENLGEALEKDSLYLLTHKEFPLDIENSNKIPKGVKLIDYVLYPDKEEDFFLISRE